MNKGEIYIVQFDPSVGHEYKGFRPALIIQSALVDKSPVITVIPFTTKIDKIYLSDIVIPKSRDNGLAKDSAALVRFITSCDRSRFHNPDFTKAKNEPRCVGTIEKHLLEKIESSLRVHLGL